MILHLGSNSPEDTLAIARALGAALRPGDVVALTGDLGAGKTLFCKGVGEALGIPPDRIVSPTFTIVTEHAGTVPLTHIDVYRLSGAREADEIGMRELLPGVGISLVEWAEKIEKLLPIDCIRVTFTISGGDRREIAVEAPDLPRFDDFRARSIRFQTGG
ncbi:tRNA (adenosine(37)-N6)-threonylcarbamoyltransferase complex ATPase subunit type 1 TsaE [Candidatus Deferrimicrobium sp.]|uniref:tRNA (adenosine(37)-N6)-threonylcarbamoyltransferase complex ATPase subunit type 1 TsaE n=1 Tax=Candidatus Deferrimicrobium sp. TaxID=3060586 RepID=UPI002ED66EF2